MPWASLLTYRQTWAFMLGKAMTDPIWLFYLLWLPKFLDATWGVKLAGLAGPLIAIYLVADVGSVGGGWFSSALIMRGSSVNRARKTALLVAALAIVPTMFAPHVKSLWLAVAGVSVAAAAHQWWSCNLFTTVSDMFPRSAVGSVVGIGGAAGALGNALMLKTAGWVLTATGSYFSLFMICGSAYLVALGVIQLMAPKLNPVEID